MYDKEKIGRTVAAIRKARGLTQEQLVELIGDDNISVSTLKRIESGRVAPDVKRLKQICQALSCDSRDLIEDDRRVALLEYFSKDNEPEDAEEEVAHILARQKLDYPEKPKQFIYNNIHINNLMQFIVYLPLMDHTLLLDCLWHISGNTFDNDYYVHKQLERLYDRIPDSDAKEYADYMAGLCTAENFLETHISGDIRAHEEWAAKYLNESNKQEYNEVWKELVRIADAYVQVIEEKAALLKNIEMIR